MGRGDTERNGQNEWTGVRNEENCLSMSGDRYTRMSIADGGDDGDTGTLQVGRGIHFWRRIMSWEDDHVLGSVARLIEILKTQLPGAVHTDKHYR